MPMEPCNYAALDPGIREVVKAVREHGFETTDSGDGCSKPRAGRTFGRMAHVVVHVNDPHSQLVSEAHRLAQFMRGVERTSPRLKGWTVEASYEVESRVGLLLLMWSGPLKPEAL